MLLGAFNVFIPRFRLKINPYVYVLFIIVYRFRYEQVRQERNISQGVIQNYCCDVANYLLEILSQTVTSSQLL